MIINDLSKLNEIDASLKWDVIIAGAGAVGLISAIKLGRLGKKVLVLESGSEQATMRAQNLNKATQTGRFHSGIMNGRARVVGGTTTLWGGQLTFFQKSDFEKVRNSQKLWPLQVEELTPFYYEAAKLLSLDLDMLSDEKILESLGFKQEISSGLGIFYTRWLNESNLYQYFYKELNESNNIFVATNQTVIGFEVDSENKISQTYCKDIVSQHEYSVIGDRVILANGTIEISRLLLSSANRNSHLPWAKNPYIGKYFQDHLDIVVGRIDKSEVDKVRDIFENPIINGKKYQPKIGSFEDHVNLNFAASLRFESNFSEDIALLKTVARSFFGKKVARKISSSEMFSLVTKVRIWLPLAWRYLKNRRIGAIADAGISIVAHCEQDPLKESYIALSPTETDELGVPLVQLNWKIDSPNQYARLKDFSTRLGEYFKNVHQVTYQELPELSQGEIFLDTGVDSYHQCGGAIMAECAEMGVVDNYCKVFETQNLYVFGAAVFPSASFANPTYTAMALALRTIDQIYK